MDKGIKRKVTWTIDQESVITLRDSDLLVSASAGSGKTTVMIQRITDMIVNGEADMDLLLVLTFTNASASDMRVKLRNKLESLLESSDISQNKKLQMQIDKMGASSIGTFHKFCSDLIATHFAVIGADPALGVMDSEETGAIKSNILDRAIADNYEKCREVIEAFSAVRSTESLKETIIHIAKFLESREDAEVWLNNQGVRSYDMNIETNIAFNKVREYYKAAGEYFSEKFGDLKMSAEMEGNTDVTGDAYTFLKHAKSMQCVKTHNDFVAMASINFPRIPTTKAAKEFSGYDALKKYRGDFKKEIETVAEHFSISHDEMLNNLAHDKKIIDQIIWLVRDLRRAYADEKRQRGKMDFSDMERFALEILGDDAVLSQLRMRYKFIFVDEYQDTNPVQEKILNIIAGDGQTMFLVGDIKQSIYGFRGCESIFFANKLTEYSDALSGRVINLNQNFRSEPKILEFVNSVFSKTMGNEMGIDYAQTSRFVPGAKYESNENTPPAVEVIAVDTKTEKIETPKPSLGYNIKESATENSETQDGTQTTDDIQNKISAQCVVVVNKINDLRNQEIFDNETKSFRKIELSDITVLARNWMHLGALSEMLSRADISNALYNPSIAHELYEIAILESFLFAVSNFHNDFHLACTMTNFVFGFSNNDLAKIKIHSGTARMSYWERVERYITENDDELSVRLANFKKVLCEFNDMARKMPVHEVLSVFIARYSVSESLLSTPQGSLRVDNIFNYIEKIKDASYATSVSRYLYLLENDIIKVTLGGQGGDGVGLMTIHMSKGLEFPVVILFDAASKFSDADKKKGVVIERECGLSMVTMNPDEYVKTPSIARFGATKQINKIMVAEEMRLLYVALTRAQNHLCIVGGFDVQKLKSEIPATPFELFKSRHYFEFLAPTVFASVPDCEFSIREINMLDVPIAKISIEQKIPASPPDIDVAKELRSVYEKSATVSDGTDIVLKQSVTSLTKTELDTIPYVTRTMFEKDRGIDYGTKFHNEMRDIDFWGGVSDDQNITDCLAVLRAKLRGAEILREIPFLQSMSDGVLVQGVIDLVAVFENANREKRIVVVDYKTTRCDAEKLKLLYEKQIGMYANSVALSMQIPPEKIERWIYSTHLKEIILT